MYTLLHAPRGLQYSVCLFVYPMSLLLSSLYDKNTHLHVFANFYIGFQLTGFAEALSFGQDREIELFFFTQIL